MKGNIMTKLDYEFEGFASGVNGEEVDASIEFTATIVNGNAVVDAETIMVWAEGISDCSETVTEMQCPQDMMEQCNQYLEYLGNEEIYSYA
jgi:hypothetical protein